MRRCVFAGYFFLVAVGCSGDKSTSNQTYVAEAQNIEPNVVESAPEREIATENDFRLKLMRYGRFQDWSSTKTKRL